MSTPGIPSKSFEEMCNNVALEREAFERAPCDGAIQCVAGCWTPVRLGPMDERRMRELLGPWVSGCACGEALNWAAGVAHFYSGSFDGIGKAGR